MKKHTYLCLIFLVILGLCSCGQRAEDGTNSESPTWQEQYDLGVLYLSEGNYEEAILAFTAAIEIDPKRPEAYVKAAEAYDILGDAEAAHAIRENGYAATGDESLRVEEDKSENDAESLKQRMEETIQMSLSCDAPPEMLFLQAYELDPFVQPATNQFRLDSAAMMGKDPASIHGGGHTSGGFWDSGDKYDYEDVDIRSYDYEVPEMNRSVVHVTAPSDGAEIWHIYIDAEDLPELYGILQVGWKDILIGDEWPVVLEKLGFSEEEALLAADYYAVLVDVFDDGSDRISLDEEPLFFKNGVPYKRIDICFNYAEDTVARHNVSFNFDPDNRLCVAKFSNDQSKFSWLEEHGLLIPHEK